MNNELKEFYGDVIITGIECGGWVCDWASLSRYGFANVEPEDIEVQILELDGDPEMSALTGPPIINIGTVANAYAAMHLKMLSTSGDDDQDTASSVLGMHSSYWGTALAARAAMDAGDIDTELASYIIQIGLFGKVIYG